MKQKKTYIRNHMNDISDIRVTLTMSYDEAIILSRAITSRMAYLTEMIDMYNERIKDGFGTDVTKELRNNCEEEYSALRLMDEVIL